MDVSVNTDMPVRGRPSRFVETSREDYAHVEPLEESRDAQVDRVWEELGYKIRPLFAKVFVVTDAPPQKAGLLWLPPKLASFYSGMGHQRLVTATVLACGPGAKAVKPTDRVCFARLQFGHVIKLPGERYFGWLEQEQIAGFVADADVCPWNG
jgi:hypothetical protein